MPKSRGKSAKKNIEEDDDLVGSITEKLKRLGKEDDVDHEIGDGFDVLTEEVDFCVYICLTFKQNYFYSIILRI